MNHIVAQSKRHKAHIIQADNGANLAELFTACGRKRDEWQLHLPECDAKPVLCKRCAKRVS